MDYLCNKQLTALVAQSLQRGTPVLVVSSLNPTHSFAKAPILFFIERNEEERKGHIWVWDYFCMSLMPWCTLKSWALSKYKWLILAVHDLGDDLARHYDVHTYNTHQRNKIIRSCAKVDSGFLNEDLLWCRPFYSFKF